MEPVDYAADAPGVDGYDFGEFGDGGRPGAVAHSEKGEFECREPPRLELLLRPARYRVDQTGDTFPQVVGGRRRLFKC